MKVKTQSKLEVPLVLEKIWQNLTPNCSAAQNNRSIWYHGWEGWSRSHYPCTLLSGTGHLAPSPLLIKKKGLVYPVFFPKHTMSTPGPEHLTHVPHCPEFKQINVWLCCSRDCRPCLHTISVRGLSATATAFMQKMQECSETDPRCVLDRHKYLVVISIKSHLLWDYQYRREHKKSYRATQTQAHKFVAWKKLHWRQGLTGRYSVISLTELRFLSDPVVALRNLAHSTENKEFVVSVVFLNQCSSWALCDMYSECFPSLYSPPIIIWNYVAKLTTLHSY